MSLCASIFTLYFYRSRRKKHFDKFENVIKDSVLYTLVNGTFCVYVFWVISGFLIYYVYSYDSTDKRQVKMFLSKYFRPLAGIFFASFLAYFLQKVKAIRSVEASIFAHSENQISSYYHNQASLVRLFYESLIGIYLEDPINIYINPLWSMKIEILGSFFLIILLSISKQIKHNWLLILITIFICLGIDVRVICFVLGAQCAAYFVCKKNVHCFWGLGACAIAILLCAGNSGLLNQLSTYSISFFSIEINIGHIYQSLMATIFVFGVVIIGKSRMQKNDNRLDVGNMSMYLYFFHWPILFSFSCELLIVGMKLWDDYMMAVVVAMIGGICFTYLVCFVIMKLIDTGWNKICKKIVDYFCGK